MYVGTPWKPAAKVTLSDITLSEIALADTCRENIVAMGYIFQAGRCYPQSGAPYIGTAGAMSSDLLEAGTPQACYDHCTRNYYSHYMGLDLEYNNSWSSSGHRCMCNYPSVTSRER